MSVRHRGRAVDALRHSTIDKAHPSVDFGAPYFNLRDGFAISKAAQSHLSWRSPKIPGVSPIFLGILQGAFTRERLRATHLITVCGSTAGSAAKRNAPAGGKKHAQACCVERHRKTEYAREVSKKHAIACPIMRYCGVVNHLEKTNSAQKKTISARY